MSDRKAMTLRLPADLADDLALVAACDGESITDAVQAAVTHWIEKRRNDPHFQAALASYLERAQRLQLAAGKPDTQGGHSG